MEIETDSGGSGVGLDARQERNLNSRSMHDTQLGQEVCHPEVATDGSGTGEVLEGISSSTTPCRGMPSCPAGNEVRASTEDGTAASAFVRGSRTGE